MHCHKRPILITLLMGLLLAAFCSQSMAYTRETELKSLSRQLEFVKEQNRVSKNHLATLKERNKRLKETLKASDIEKKYIAQSELEVAKAHVALEGMGIAIADAKQNIKTVQAAIDQVQQQLWRLRVVDSAAEEPDVQKELKKRLQVNKKALNYEQQRLKALNALQELSHAIYDEQLQWATYLKKLMSAKQLEKSKEDLRRIEARLSSQQQFWLQKIVELDHELEDLGPEASSFDLKRTQLNSAILEASEENNLTHLQILLLRSKGQIAALSAVKYSDMSANALSNSSTQTGMLVAELKQELEAIEHKLKILDSRKKILVASKPQYQASELYTNNLNLLDRLIDSYNVQLGVTQSLIDQAGGVQNTIRKEVALRLSMRHGVPGWSAKEWLELGKQLVVLPALLIRALGSFQDQMQVAFASMTDFQGLLLVLVEFSWFIVWLVARHYLTVGLVRPKARERTLAKSTVYTAFVLMDRNLNALVFFCALLSLIYLANIPYAAYSILLYVGLVWFCFKPAIDLSRLCFLETMTDIFGEDVKLYHRLKWILIVGGVLSFFAVITYQLPTDPTLRDFFMRLFMLFLSAVAFVLLRSWRVVPSLLSPYLENRSNYAKRVVQILCFLIPFLTLINALIGLFGYLELAVNIARHEAIFLFVFSIYIMVRGFLIDSIEKVYEYFIRHVSNGWLWTQAILKPLDKLLRLGLLILAILVLFSFYHYGPGSVFYQKAMTILHAPLFHLGDTNLSLLSIIELVVMVAVLLWVARWTREFAYRWLYARAKDVGIRNSLAVFTQYSVVLLGILTILNALGIGLTGLAVVAGGLAVGIGFGLRDLANNFVCGILLLIERPVRKGDFVSIGEYEGEVSHIGTRSMTVSTWDHMEVLVPNSDTFSKPFTNWTLQDSIVRTVVSIKISRNDDPFQVRAIIIGVLDELEAVVSDPAPQVFLKDIDDVLIEFEVRYYINLLTHTSRPEVRSAVLFNIWKRFEKFGIKPPHPKQDIYVRSLPED